MVLSSRNPEEAAETLRARHDVRIEIVPGSVAEPAVAAALAETASGLGGASAFLLNHGGPPVKPLMAITDEDWSQSFEIMVNGPLRVLRALVPQMQEAESGRVVAVSSCRVALNCEMGNPTGSGQNMGVMRRVFCLRRSADHRELRPL
ncbi:SDR family NAD(P)-dependent oxidoreductase [Aquicoccus porphyridii]|uniref:SDR family NAD(P)-dependent oxidoreductase n=1 Tax=Aquicoccus porphyridii TaxID=1852029 RepID=A0A5A9YXG7_9RHOB